MTMETSPKRSKRIRLKKITKKKRPKKSMRISMDMIDLKFRSLAKIEKQIGARKEQFFRITKNFFRSGKSGKK